MLLLPVVASADEVEIDGIYYNVVNKLKTAEITRNPNLYVGDITIPDKIIYEGTEYSVTTIGISAFSCCYGLTSITIPESVTSIGDGAFVYCTGLKSIAIPSSITSIGDGAFRDCTGLTSVHISDLEAWFKISFKTYANPVIYAHHLFLNGEEIKDLVIPNNITTIGSYAFWGCSGLNSVTIPNSITKIGYYAFRECDGLTSVHISDLEAWCKISFETSANPLYDAHHLFLNGEEIKDLVIPNNITTIGSYAFWGCSYLNSITIPNSVTNIGEHAFQFCSGLSNITIPDNVTTIENYAFTGCSGLISIKIGNGLTSIEDGVFSSCSGLTSIIIPDNITSIGNNAFAYCSGMTSVILGKGITSIGKSAFASCEELTDVYSLAEAVPNTKSNAFNNSYIDYAILHVPEASADLYSSKNPWKNFKSIVKIMPMYTLTYMVDGDTYKSYQVEEDAIIKNEPIPIQEGYTFSGWSEIPETMPAHDVIVTGSFSINSYKLTYIVDGEQYKTEEIEYNSVITQEAEPTKDGHTFSGWGEIPETMPANDVTVTGSFTINSYTLAYMVDGDIYKVCKVYYGTTITPEIAPTREGYTFSGWCEIPETMPANDVLVTGTFTINSYKLTYMIDDQVYKETMYEYGATITPESQPEGDYATFEWIDLPETMPAHDVVVYANYSTGIGEVLTATQRNTSVYSIDGKNNNKLKKGLNIVIPKNDKAKKVLVK